MDEHEYDNVKKWGLSFIMAIAYLGGTIAVYKFIEAIDPSIFTVFKVFGAICFLVLIVWFRYTLFNKI